MPSICTLPACGVKGLNVSTLALPHHSALKDAEGKAPAGFQRLRMAQYDELRKRATAVGGTSCSLMRGEVSCKHAADCCMHAGAAPAVGWDPRQCVSTFAALLLALHGMAGDSG